jgi:hypothetical protein
VSQAAAEREVLVGHRVQGDEDAVRRKVRGLLMVATDLCDFSFA